MYVPEEMGLNANYLYSLVITSRGSVLGDGLTVAIPSAVYWVNFQTS